MLSRCATIIVKIKSAAFGCGNSGLCFDWYLKIWCWRKDDVYIADNKASYLAIYFAQILHLGQLYSIALCLAGNMLIMNALLAYSIALCLAGNMIIMNALLAK